MNRKVGLAGLRDSLTKIPAFYMSSELIIHPTAVRIESSKAFESHIMVQLHRQCAHSLRLLHCVSVRDVLILMKIRGDNADSTSHRVYELVQNLSQRKSQHSPVKKQNKGMLARDIKEKNKIKTRVFMKVAEKPQ